ncbi:hypothetical protein MVEG_10021 [Podila verticillata NRRL 6337]|nr:hypothetical protein MVEG_10021 [Podila verticillata NRRL 6337]
MTVFAQRSLTRLLTFVAANLAAYLVSEWFASLTRLEETDLWKIQQVQLEQAQRLWHELMAQQDDIEVMT